MPAQRGTRHTVAWSVCVTAVVLTFSLVLLANPSPPVRSTGAPGDSLCTRCHAGTANSGPGRVSIAFPTGLTYTPGATQRLSVTITDPDLAKWAFQMTARLASNLSDSQAGNFRAINTLTQVVTSTPVQFVQTTSGGTQQGVRGSATYQFDWTAPSTNVGNIVFYVAGMAANGSGRDGDRVYTADATITPATSTTPALQVTPSSLAFDYLIGGASPAAQNVSVASTGSPVIFTAAVSGGSWLSATNTSGTTPRTLSVSANPAGLAAGSYNGALTISAGGASNSPQTVPVTLTVRTAPPPPPPPSTTGQFKFNILKIVDTKPGQYPRVTFSVTDPAHDNEPYDIVTHPAFTQVANSASRIFVQIGWDTNDFTNTGSGSELATSGAAAAQPIAVNALAAPSPNADGSFTVRSAKPIPSFVRGTGQAALEGHPAGQDASGAWTVRVPVKSVFKSFIVTGESRVERRRVVDTKKCKSCHGVLSLHGNNRTDEVQVCVMCHNPNATDIPYRQLADGPETSIDMKVMVHAIHAASKRTTPYIVIGRSHSVNDFSSVQYPATLRDCRKCHREGTYLLPLKSRLGTTIDTQSVMTTALPVVNGDPADDFKITPAAATCSACHDSEGARNHMISKGASFSTLQQSITSGAVRERCADCHGAGKDKDVEKVHAVR